MPQATPGTKAGGGAPSVQEPSSGLPGAGENALGGGWPRLWGKGTGPADSTPMHSHKQKT